MLGVRRVVAVLVTAVLVASVAAAGATPNEDGQPATAPSRYDASQWRGWMTSAATDRVYDIAQIGDTVYVAGTFTGVRPSRTGTITAQGYLAAFDAATGALRTGFQPVLNNTVHTLEVAPDGSRLYIGGSFTSLNGAAKARLAVLDPVTGATIPGLPNVGGGTIRSLQLRGSTLYLGGNFNTVKGQSRIRLAAVDVTTNALSATWVPTADGGTVLTLELAPDGSRLYVGGRFTTLNGSALGGYVAALDPVTGQQLTGFAARPGREVFDVLADDVRGLVWVGLGGALGRLDVYRADGSLLTRHETAGDTEAVEQVGGLIYAGGHDLGSLEDDHIGVVDPAAPAILDTTSFDEPSTGGDGVWAIHSTGTDLWLGGNTTAPWYGFTRHAAVADPPARTELVPVLSSWRTRDTGSAPAGWTSPGFDDSTWPSQWAELGFGDSGEASLLTPGRVTYHFRRTFTVSDRSTLADLRLEVLADDGAVVHLNGVEVARSNMPTGPVTDSTRAVNALFGNVEDSFVSFSLPGSVLVEGTNTIAVEVHQNASSSTDLSFDARLSAVRLAAPVPDLTDPSIPTGLAAAEITRTGARVIWPASTDDVAMDHYDVFVDGSWVGAPLLPVFELADLAPATSYSVQVRAVDAAGNLSELSEPLIVRTSFGPVDLVALGSRWRYRDNGVSPPANWTEVGYDDAAWLEGPAMLGRQKGDEATVLAPGYGTTWFRRAFTVTDAGVVAGLRVDLAADDGARVFVNGVEVVRDNLPAGTITDATPTTTYRTGTSERALRSFTVPASVLQSGANVIAVAVHQGSGSPDVVFDLRLVGL